MGPEKDEVDCTLEPEILISRLEYDEATGN